MNIVIGERPAAEFPRRGKGKQNNTLSTFSYSEQWRYKGSVKLRQPLGKGRCQPERV